MNTVCVLLFQAWASRRPGCWGCSPAALISTGNQNQKINCLKTNITWRESLNGRSRARLTTQREKFGLNLKIWKAEHPATDSYLNLSLKLWSYLLESQSDSFPVLYFSLGLGSKACTSGIKCMHHLISMKTRVSTRIKGMCHCGY